MTIGGRFEAALRDAEDPELVGQDLLPVRLARAAARSLPADGVGLSLVAGNGRRVPLGASCAESGTAERLQFTVGTGPCTAAQETRQPVFALAPDLQRRWPALADLLLAQTPYRAVVALPLQPSLPGAGAMDLYFRREDAVPELDVFAAVSVAELVRSHLAEAPRSCPDGPAWLRGPGPRARARVWEAAGTVAVALDLDAPAALAVLRAAAYSRDRTVDELAADVLAGRLAADELRLADGPS